MNKNLKKILQKKVLGTIKLHDPFKVRASPTECQQSTPRNQMFPVKMLTRSLSPMTSSGKKITVRNPKPRKYLK